MLINSVLGKTPLNENKTVLPHEHLVLDYRQKDGKAPPPSKEEELEMVQLLAGLSRDGIQAIVDCTPPGYGRDIAFLQSVSKQSDVAIIASTGTFCEQWSPLPKWVQGANEQALSSAFTAELDRGCGVIKVATSARITPPESIALTAASKAHRTTNSPIVSHTTGGGGLEQLEIYERNGVDLSSVLISHVCSADETLDYAVEIAKRGAYVGLDRIGHSMHEDVHWITIIKHLVSAGYQEHILLSQDSVQRVTGPEEITRNSFKGIGYVNSTFRENAIDNGVREDIFDAIVKKNPVRWLNRDREKL